MGEASILDYTTILKKLMASVEISNFKQLSEQAGVSPKQIRRLRQGKVKQMRVEVLLALAQVLSVSLSDLIEWFSSETVFPASVNTEQELREKIREEVQQESLQIIEPWLLQWPTAVSAIAQNPELPAQRVIKLLNPLEKLLQFWGVEKIGEVGEQVTYNPQQHQLLSGNVQPKATVRVRYVGYRQGEKLLYRAKVEPID